jgi:hypothetical protein
MVGARASIHPDLRRLQVSPTQIRLLQAMSDGWRLRCYDGLFYLRDGGGAPSAKHPSTATVRSLIDRSLIIQSAPHQSSLATTHWRMTDKASDLIAKQRKHQEAAQ